MWQNQLQQFDRPLFCLRGTRSKTTRPHCRGAQRIPPSALSFPLPPPSSPSLSPWDQVVAVPRREALWRHRLSCRWGPPMQLQTSLLFVTGVIGWGWRWCTTSIMLLLSASFVDDKQNADKVVTWLVFILWRQSPDLLSNKHIYDAIPVPGFVVDDHFKLWMLRPLVVLWSNMGGLL